MVSTLTRIFGVSNLELVEDVVQDALVTALRRWRYTGVPDNPSAWIIQVAKNNAVERMAMSCTCASPCRSSHPNRGRSRPFPALEGRQRVDFEPPRSSS